MKIISFCFLLFNMHLVLGQSLSWVKGTVVLESEDVLIGKLLVNLEHDVVLFEDPHTHRRSVYPAHKLSSIYFHDDRENVNRRYVCVRDDSKLKSYRSMYEVVLSGEVEILRRHHMRGSRSIDPLDYDYFIRYREEMTPIRKFRNEVYPMLLELAARQLQTFVRRHALNANNDVNTFRIVEYYNGLFRQDEAFARQ